ncbi:MAG: hypothetical protein HY519_01175 [Candidatus Aenigmarchaeota archaeon]|nr:hypothetical protein [Candidatus Aenigmarchaeota archaeon]
MMTEEERIKMKNLLVPAPGWTIGDMQTGPNNLIMWLETLNGETAVWFAKLPCKIADLPEDWTPGGGKVHSMLPLKFTGHSIEMFDARFDSSGKLVAIVVCTKLKNDWWYIRTWHDDGKGGIVGRIASQNFRPGHLIYFTNFGANVRVYVDDEKEIIYGPQIVGEKELL